MKTLSKFLSFCVVGGLTFVIDIAFLNIFFFIGLNFPLARTMSIAIALIFNFFVNRNFTFKARHKHPGKQAIPYIIVYIVSNLINLLTSILIVSMAGENVFFINFASVIGTIISIPFSFFGSLIWVFRKN